MPQWIYYGEDCSGAVLAPLSNAAVQAKIDEMLTEVRQVCPNNSFVAVLRGDDAWVMIPTIGTQGNHNLCTIWPGARSLGFDVRSQEDRRAGRRPYPDTDGPNLLTRLRARYNKMAALWQNANP